MLPTGPPLLVDPGDLGPQGVEVTIARLAIGGPQPAPSTVAPPAPDETELP